MTKGSGYAEGRHGKGRLFQRGRVWWVQYYVHGQMVRESSHSDKWAVAEKLLMRRLIEAEDGTAPIKQRPIKYEEMRQRLITKRRLDGLDEKDAESGLKFLDQYFAGLKFITEEKIDTFKLARKASGVSNATINRSLAALRQMVSLSAKRLKNPPVIKLLPEPPARKGFLTREQYLRLLAALPSRVRPIFRFGYHTGMRLGELQNLTWSRVDMRARMIRLEAEDTKSGEGRFIPFGKFPELADLMTQLRNQSASDFVFSRGGFRKAWARACVRTGLGRMLWNARPATDASSPRSNHSDRAR